MEWKNGGQKFANDHVFTEEAKASICPNDIHQWFCLTAYRMENLTPKDNPIHSRSWTLAYHKKAISYFMDSNEAWNKTHQAGNPRTCSQIINWLIAAVCQEETWGVGSAAQADRHFTDEEMEKVIDSFKVKGSMMDQHRHAAMVTFQIHLVGCGDDCSKVLKSYLQQNSQFQNLLTRPPAWSKNVYEERDCPKQMVLSSTRDSRFCVLLNLSLFLEKWLRDGVGTQLVNGCLQMELQIKWVVTRMHRTKKQSAVRLFKQRL